MSTVYRSIVIQTANRFLASHFTSKPRSGTKLVKHVTAEVSSIENERHIRG